MSHDEQKTFRVAIVGSGPAAFYTAQQLLLQSSAPRIDMFEKLPAPFGLVRYGVAPDHEKIKSVTRIYDTVARREEFRFFGNVEYGRDLTLDTLQRRYHQIVFCTGAQTDRSLGIPGEELPGSHAATEFVAWYNGHPDFRKCAFDLTRRTAIVIGVGNVAIDVARILCRTADELRQTDIAEHALEALEDSAIEEVILLGRRGPAQAAFTGPEVKELGELSRATPTTRTDEVQLDALSAAALAHTPDKATRRKVEILQSYADRAVPAGHRRLTLRFLVSPLEILGSAARGVTGIRIARTVLEGDPATRLTARVTDDVEELPAGLVFRSVGYRGVALPGLPFDERSGCIPNAAGRISGGGGECLRGLYTAGWIKRGPSGVIGTNKPDAVETVAAMIEDRERGRLLTPDRTDDEAMPATMRALGLRWIDYEQWLAIDACERHRGEQAGRPRIKCVEPAEFFEALEPRSA